jgi:hypothetical protein
MHLKKSIATPLLAVTIAMVISACDPQGQVDKDPPQSPPDTQTPVSLSASSDPLQPEETLSTRPTNDQAPLPTISSATADDGYQEINWDDLIPKEYQPDSIIARYKDQLETLDDSDPKAMELYGTIQAELDNAPVNDAINGKKIKLPGFIAPLENTEDKVTVFLLVPYFGACIHVPPPPVNQTVMVSTGEGQGIAASDSGLPFWVKGVISTEGESTGIGSAGYRIDQAQIEQFK